MNTKSDFEDVLKNGKRLYTDGCVVVYLQSDNSKFGLVASKRICRNSVNRNKFKRHLREFYRNNLSTKKFKFIFIATKNPKFIIFKDLIVKIKIACESAGIIDVHDL